MPSIASAADPVLEREQRRTVSSAEPKDLGALHLFAIGAPSSGELLRIANDSQETTDEPSARLAACYAIHRKVLPGYLRMHACPLFVADAGSPWQARNPLQVRLAPLLNEMTAWVRSRVGAGSVHLAG